MYPYILRLLFFLFIILYVNVLLLCLFVFLFFLFSLFSCIAGLFFALTVLICSRNREIERIYLYVLLIRYISIYIYWWWIILFWFHSQWFVVALLHLSKITCSASLSSLCNLTKDRKKLHTSVFLIFSQTIQFCFCSVHLFYIRLSVLYRVRAELICNCILTF